MTQLKWNQPKDQTFEAGLDRGVLYLDSGDAVPWNGLSSVDDGGESTTKEFYIDGIKYLSTVSARDWKGVLTAFTYPDAFAELIGISTLGDGLYVDSQAPGRFGLSYRTMVSSGVDSVQHYKIHLIYQVMASLAGFTNKSLSADAIDPTAFQFDLSAVPIQIPNHRPSAHIILDTRDLDAMRLDQLNILLYGDSTHSPSLPAVTDLVDLLNFGDGVIIVYNGDGTWTATGSNENVYMTGPHSFEIDNVAAEYLTPDIYQFLGLETAVIVMLVADTDGVPYYKDGEGPSNVNLDTDGIPYFEDGVTGASIIQDTDGVPYFQFY